MRVSKLRLAAVALISGITLGGCAYGFGDPYGSYGGLGVGYGNYGYGYGSPYGYGGYPYGGYGYGYGNPYGGFGDYLGYGYGGYPYGWYNGYYYPGTGYYVYDRNHRRRQITDAERQYWRDKFGRMTGTTGTTTTTATTTSSITPRENWSGFKRIRTRSVDSGSTTTTSRGSDRGFWRHGSASTSSSQSSSSTSSSNGNRSSDFWQRHSPRRPKD